MKKNNLNITLLLLHIFLATLRISCQDLYFKEASLLEKETSLVINDFVSDKNGMIWMASNEGLLLSDGDDLIPLQILDSTLQSPLNAIHQHGNLLYLGSVKGGLYIYSILENKVLKSFNLNSSPITSITNDHMGNIWTASEENGIFLIQGDQVRLIDVNFGLSDNIIHELVFDASKNLVWAASDRGINKCQIDGSKINVEVFGNKDGLNDQLITSIELDRSGALWAGSHSGDVYYISPSFEIKNLTDSLWSSSQITDITSVNDQIWVASKKNGIALFDDAEKKILSIEREAKLSRPRKILFHRLNQLIVLNAENEFYISDINIRFYPDSIESLGSQIQVVYSDINNQLYLATESSISIKNTNGQFEKIIDLKKEQINYVISLLVASDSSLWFGTFDQGLYRYKNGTLAHYSENDGLINNNVMSLHEWKGSIWCATLGGLCEVSSNNEIEFMNYAKDEGLDASYIYQLSSSEKSLYIASDGEGLIRFDGKQFERISNENVESCFDITSLKEDHLFVSSENGKIVAFENGVQTRCFNLMRNNKGIEITGLRQLSDSTLLFIWEKGIGLFNIWSNKHQLYSDAWGLFDFNNDFLNTISCDRNGNTYVSNHSQLLKIDQGVNYASIEENSFIRSVSLFSSPIDTSLHEFDHEDNHFTFSFNAIRFQEMNRVQYQYRLLGLNNSWTSTKDKVAVYPKLKSGSYRFEFRAGNVDSLKHAQIHSYSFIIAKAFYKTWWFLLIIAVLLITVTYAFFKHRESKSILKKRMEYERVLSQFELLKSQINPHFLFNSLNTAYALVSKDEKEAQDYILSLSSYLRTILAKNQDHVIPLRKELKFAQNYTQLQKKRFGENIQFQFSLDDELILDSYIPPLTLQILLENAIKHNIISRSNPLSMNIYTKDQFIYVENNLQVKINKAEGTKIGLSNIKSRYQILFNKEIFISSDNDKYVVKLPIIKSYAKNSID